MRNLSPPLIPKDGIQAELLGVGSRDLDRAAQLIRAGKLVAFPTETVYGLGADATSALAVARIFAAKGRPHFNPLIAHVEDLAAAQKLAAFSPLALTLAQQFWPGPLTLVLPALAQCPVCDLARAGLNTIAIRVPAHPVARALIAAAGCPIAGPSANRSGHVSPSLAAHVLADLDGRIEAIIDAGASEIGVESTILAVFEKNIVLLRPGGITRAAIIAATGSAVEDSPPARNGETPLAPGRLQSHYAPSKPLRLDASFIAPDEVFLGFGPFQPAGWRKTHALNLSQNGDLIEAAANLYQHLRALDQRDSRAIAVAPLPLDGMGEALRDRLIRAAAPRASLQF
jgi:L-threonylcarbamoyladenylate synthase